jgi:putative transposase
MPETFTQLYVQIVFAVKYRQKLLQKEWRQHVFKYMSGIIKAKGHKPIIVNGVEDHVHILVGLNPTMTIADLARDIKNNSTNFINDNKLTPTKFSWQRGYGAFSYADSEVKNVFNYIANQEQHHQKQSFQIEYENLLKEFDIPYNPKYLFDGPADEPK